MPAQSNIWRWPVCVFFLNSTRAGFGAFLPGIGWVAAGIGVTGFALNAYGDFNAAQYDMDPRAQDGDLTVTYWYANGWRQQIRIRLGAIVYSDWSRGHVYYEEPYWPE